VIAPQPDESSVRLSVCIPTYNFGGYLGETLDSVLSQTTSDVEVVVLDGGSTDNTLNVVRTYQRHFPGLHYYRRETRGGFDRDLLRTVALARGQYCWLFGADDLMKPQAIPRMLDQIRGGHDLYLCGFTICTKDMTPVTDHPVLKVNANTAFDLSDTSDRRTYFERALTTTAFFSFLGSLVIKRARWDSVPVDEEFLGSHWIHAAQVFGMLPMGLRVKYLASPYLDKRMENDSFSDRGSVHRCAIAIDGYHRLARRFFPEDSADARDIRRVVTNEYSPATLLSVKLANRTRNRPDDVRTLDLLAARAYGDSSLRNRLYRLVYQRTPLFVFRTTRAVYRGLRFFWRAHPSSKRSGAPVA
jgi:abequosyltransferase